MTLAVCYQLSIFCFNNTTGTTVLSFPQKTKGKRKRKQYEQELILFEREEIYISQLLSVVKIPTENNFKNKHNESLILDCGNPVFPFINNMYVFKGKIIERY